MHGWKEDFVHIFISRSKTNLCELLGLRSSDHSRCDGRRWELWDICGIKWTSWGLMKLNNADVCLQLSDAHLTKPGTLYRATMVNKYLKRINSLCLSASIWAKPREILQRTATTVNKLHELITAWISHLICLSVSSDCASLKVLWEGNSVWHSIKLNSV